MPTSYQYGTSNWYPNIITTTSTNPLTLVRQLSYPGGVLPKDINEFLKMALIDKSIGFYYYYT